MKRYAFALAGIGLLLAAFVVTFAAGCKPLTPPIPPCPLPCPQPPPQCDADPTLPECYETTRVNCVRACDHMAKLGCPAAQPTPAGATCAAVCQNVQDVKGLRWDLACRAKATSCAAADRCEAR